MASSIHDRPHRRYGPFDRLADSDAVQTAWRVWQDAPIWVRTPIEILCMLVYDLFVLAAQVIEWVVERVILGRLHERVRAKIALALWILLWGALLWWLPLWVGISFLVVFLLTYLVGEIALRYDAHDPY